jgi:hypothetical protein
MKRLKKTRTILQECIHVLHVLTVLILALGILWDVIRLAFHLG